MKRYLKSIHTRYMLTFMTIMIMTILILGIIITNIITSFSLDTKLNQLYETNVQVSSYFKVKEIDGELPPIENKEGNGFSPILEETLDTIFLISPQTGIVAFNEVGELILFASMNENNIVKSLEYNNDLMGEITERQTLPSGFLNKISRDKVVSTSDTADGYFKNSVYLYATAITTKVEVEEPTLDEKVSAETKTETDLDTNPGSDVESDLGTETDEEKEPVYEDKFLGAIICYDLGNTKNDKMMHDMMIAIISTILWITLASLVAIYGVSYYTMKPLREIGHAAKSFSRGKFDVRVKVRGKDELAELADSFNKMAIAIQSKDEMQKNFLSNVSHDLKTPMTTIAGFIDGILDGAIPPEKEEYYLNIIKNEVKRLSRLVTSLLDISRLQSGERKFEFKQFNLSELVRQTVLSFEHQLEQKRLDVEFDMDDYDMMAYGDKDAINQVVYNLCHNAIKFSNDGGKYEVSLKYEADDTIRFTMYNEGIGISSDDLPFVFDRFYKSDKSRGLDKTGTGLGLFIAKTIIDAHSGSIVANSEYGKWCEMSFTISRTSKA